MLSESGDAYDPFEALCDAVFPDDEDGLMFFWKACFDGSGKHSDLLVVAGYLSDRPHWKAFNQAWRPLLTTNGKFAPFHAADFESGNGDFTTGKGWTKERRDKVRPQLIDVLLGAGLHTGVACSVKIHEYEQNIPGWRRNLLGLGTAYEFAVSACMGAVAAWCQHNNQPHPVQYIVEHGEGKEGKLADAFKNSFAHEGSRRFFRLGKLVFDTKDGAIGLQAADMLANYTWNWKSGNRPPIEPYTRITHAKNLLSDYFDKERLLRETATDKAGRDVVTPEGSWKFQVPDAVDIEVRVDFSEVEKIVAELERLSESVPERVYSVVKHPSNFEKLFTVEAENTNAEGTNELRIAFKPNDLALSTLTALGASDTDSNLSEWSVSHD